MTEDQGPELVLSETRLVKGKEFSLTLELQKRDADAISTEQVYDAMTRATCHSEREPETVIHTCFCCKGAPLITLEATDHNVFEHKRDGDGSAEFTLDRCRPNCSSSRDHFKSRLFIVVEGIGPRRLSATTKLFTIVSRDKTSRSCPKDQLFIKEYFFVKQELEQVETTSTPTEYKRCMRHFTPDAHNWALVAQKRTVNPVDLLWQKMKQPPLETMKEAAHCFCGPRSWTPRRPVFPQIAHDVPDRTLTPFHAIQGTKVAVRVFATRLSPETISPLVEDFQQTLQK